MSIDGWKYYNHAVIPTTAPHEEPDLEPVYSGLVWANIWRGGTPLLARWTSNWDCGYETNWWYVIKDTPFDISALKSKRRYEINRGNKNFVVKEISPIDYADDLFAISKAAYESYPESYRPKIDHEKFVNNVEQWKFYKTYGAFSIEDNLLCGYACLKREGSYMDFCLMKANPEREKLGLNAAMVYMILSDNKEFLSNGGYICDGARSIQHETAFQEYLEKYFEFRKAYCKLHIIYSPALRMAVNIAYPIRGLLSKLSRASAIRQFNALLRMEEINRSFV